MIRAYLIQQIELAVAAGIVPILVATIHRNDDTAKNARVTVHNAWLRTYAWANGYTYIDPFSVLVDPATGGLLTALLLPADDLHPNSAGAKLAGEKALTDLTTALTGNSNPSLAPFVIQATDAGNKFTNPLFNDDVNSDGNADYWGNAGGPSLAVDARVIGKIQSYSVSTATNFNQNFVVDAAAFSVGDRLSLSGLIEVDATTSDFQWHYFLKTLGQAGTWESNPIGYPGGGPVGIDLTLSAFYCELVIPTGATSVWAGGRAFAGTGVLKAAQWCLANRTTGEVFDMFV